MRRAKTLIKLGGCAGWSESSLGAQPFCWFCHVAGHTCIHLDPNIQDTCIHEHIKIYPCILGSRNTRTYHCLSFYFINLKEYISSIMLCRKKNVFAFSWTKYLGSRTVRKKNLCFSIGRKSWGKKTQPSPPRSPRQKIKWTVPWQIFSWRGSYGVMLFFSLFSLQ